MEEIIQSEILEYCVDEVQVLVRRVSKLNGLAVLKDPSVPVSLCDGSRPRDNSPSKLSLVFVPVKSEVCSIPVRTSLPPLPNILQLPGPAVQLLSISWYI